MGVGTKKEQGQKEEKGKGWQRRTLPPSHPGSTIRAHELNDRVRDGTGWTLTALATNTRAFVFFWTSLFPHQASVLTRFVLVAFYIPLFATRQRPCLPA